MSHNLINGLDSIQTTGETSRSGTGDIALAVGIESLNVYDGKVNSYYKTVHNQNGDMKTLNQAMQWAADHQNLDHGVRVDERFWITDGRTGKKEYKSLCEIMDSFGIKYPSKPDAKDWAHAHNFNKNDMKTVLDNIKTASDSISSSNQISMMKLQSVLNKENQMSSMTSNIMSKDNTASMGIIGNFAR